MKTILAIAVLFSFCSCAALQKIQANPKTQLIEKQLVEDFEK